MLKSLRYRLLLWFVLSTILISASSFVLIRVHRSAKTNQQKVSEQLSFFRYQFLKDQTQVANFLSTETTNQNFYLTGESEYLFGHYRHVQNIDSCYVHCISKDDSPEPNNYSLSDIRQTYSNYCILLDSLVYKIYRRGYDNLGLQGELASYMYQLEKFNQLSTSDITSIKLAEKEYGSGHDTAYASFVNSLCNNLITNTLLSKRYSPAEKKEIVNLIKSYKNTFNNIVDIDTEIGEGAHSGLKHEITELGYQLEDLVDSSILEARQVYQSNMKRINLLFGFLTLVLIAVGFVISFYTSKALFRHLDNLTTYINQLARNGVNQQLDFNLRHSTIEIRHIYLEFRNMLSDLRMREKQRDRALRIAEENQLRYQELADLLPQCIYETDRLGNLTYVNKAWYKTFGYRPFDVDQGINLIEILNANKGSVLFGNSKVENNDFVATRKDGTNFPATVYSDTIKKGVRVVGRRGIIIDSTLKHKYIETLKKKTDKAISSDKHKSSFLANMSHEIRTPMNSIIGFTNMLSSKEVPDNIKGEFIGHIQTSSELLLNLIDDIIDIAKIEDGQLKIKKTDCEVHEIADTLVNTFTAYRQRFEKGHIEIKTNLPADKVYFRTDSFRLNQIITNLMSNAIKFTEKGWVELGVSIKDPQTLKFYVKDSGIGMTQNDLHTVFERFKRTKLTEEKKISGTGLGLAISKNLVEILGGKMWVSSLPGQGTCFTFELPYLRVEKPLVQAKKVSTQVINLKGKKVLVAEDDDSNFSLINHILEQTQAEVIRAHNGRDAVQAIAFHNDISLILMDLRMPHMNGLEATTIIKEEYPNLPIIAQTAFAMEGDRNTCLEAGCDDYIPKPIKAEALYAKIAQFVYPEQFNLPSNTTNKVNSKSDKEEFSIKKNNNLLN